jgi:hypothetical protein
MMPARKPPAPPPAPPHAVTSLEVLVQDALAELREQRAVTRQLVAVLGDLRDELAFMRKSADRAARVEGLNLMLPKDGG